MKHIKKFEGISFENEVMDVFQEALDEFGISRCETGSPSNNSITYDIMVSDSELTIIFDIDLMENMLEIYPL